MSKASDEFIAEMNYDTKGQPNTEWCNFDSPFPRSVVAPFERRGWIETRSNGWYVEHRWTALGIAEQLAAHLRSLGYRVERPHGLLDKLRAAPTPTTAAHGATL